MMQIIAQRQPEIAGLRRAVALQVEVRSIRMAYTVLLHERVRNIQRHDKSLVEEFSLNAHVHADIAGRGALWIGIPVEQTAARDIPKTRRRPGEIEIGIQ